MRNISLAVVIAAAVAPASAFAGAPSAEYRVFDSKIEVSKAAEAVETSTVKPIASADVGVSVSDRGDYSAAVTSFADRNGDGVVSGKEVYTAKRRFWNRELAE